MTRERDAPSKPLSIIDNTVNSMDPLFHVLYALVMLIQNLRAAVPAQRLVMLKVRHVRRGEERSGVATSV